MKTIYLSDALALLNNGDAHRLTVYKLGNGEILTYPDALCIGRHDRSGVVRLKLRPSGQVRTCRAVCLRTIDDLFIYI